jgi:hypothetical protein
MIANQLRQNEGQINKPRAWRTDCPLLGEEKIPCSIIGGDA